jgi:hypothetical protein
MSQYLLRHVCIVEADNQQSLIILQTNRAISKYPLNAPARATLR